MDDQNKNGGIVSPADGKNAVHVRHGDVIMTVGEKSSFFYTVRDPIGIHARPAAALVKLAKNYKSTVTFSAGEKSARADSVIDLMSLGAKHETRLKITAHGEDEQEALDAFRAFLCEHL